MTTVPNAPDDYPESWRPEQPGDQLTGEFVRLTRGYTRDGDSAVIAIFRTAEGERSVWLWHTILKSRLQRARPEPGDVITITYKGKKETGSGRQAHDYAVSGGREEVLGWDDLESRPEPEPQLDFAREEPPEPSGRQENDIPF